MGYRSNVRILTSKNGYEKLQKHVSEYLKEKNIDYNLLENSDLRFVSSKGVLIGWNYIKWYDWLEGGEVDSIMSSLKKLKDEDFSYRYARIGESYCDLEEDYYDSRSNDEDFDADIDIICEFNDCYMEDQLMDERIKNNKDNGVEI